MLKDILVPINRAGYPFIAIFAAAMLLLYVWWAPLGFIGLVLTAWCIYFFRDPERIKPLTRVAVFMNVFNVHVNRVPVNGVISGKHYRPGKFFNASLDKASEFNERMSLKVKMKDDREIGFVQIAGLVARRIICDVDEGRAMRAGERFGLIRFGSRVDIYLPEGTVPAVIEGQIAIAGETVLADLKAKGDARKGEVR